MCMRQQLDHETCTEVMRAFLPCEDEWRRRRIKAARDAEERARQQLTEASKAAASAHVPTVPSR